MTWARDLGLAKPYIAAKLFASEEEMRQVVSNHSLTLAGALMVNGLAIKIPGLGKSTVLGWYKYCEVSPPAK